MRSKQSSNSNVEESDQSDQRAYPGYVKWISSNPTVHEKMARKEKDYEKAVKYYEIAAVLYKIH